MTRRTRNRLIVIAIAVITLLYFVLFFHHEFKIRSRLQFRDVESTLKCIEVQVELPGQEKILSKKKKFQQVPVCMLVYPCAFNLRLNQETVHRLVPHFALTPSFTVGFVSQSSMNRLFRLKSLLMNEIPSMVQRSKISKHSVSLSLVIYTQNVEHDWKLINEQIYRDVNVCGDALWCMNNILIHLVYKDQFLPYPINVMRNIGLMFSRANWIMIHDMDFIFSNEVIADLEATIESKSNSKLKLAEQQQEKLMFVVPAFEFDDHKTNSDCNSVMTNKLEIQCNYGIPKSKNDLLVAWNQRVIDPFHFSHWKPGHQTTDYPRWRNATTAYSVGHEQYYEPYAFFSRRIYVDRSENGVLCDERFYNRGRNKVICYDRLRWDYCLQPIVLPQSYMVHFYEQRKKDDSMFLSYMPESNSLYEREMQLYKNKTCDSTFGSL